jgi:hypothetical protein
MDSSTYSVARKETDELDPACRGAPHRRAPRRLAYLRDVEEGSVFVPEASILVLNEAHVYIETAVFATMSRASCSAPNGAAAPIACHTFRATRDPAYLANSGALEHAQANRSAPENITAPCLGSENTGDRSPPRAQATIRIRARSGCRAGRE